MGVWPFCRWSQGSRGAPVRSEGGRAVGPCNDFPRDLWYFSRLIFGYFGKGVRLLHGLLVFRSIPLKGRGCFLPFDERSISDHPGAHVPFQLVCLFLFQRIFCVDGAFHYLWRVKELNSGHGKAIPCHLVRVKFGIDGCRVVTILVPGVNGGLLRSILNVFHFFYGARYGRTRKLVGLLRGAFGFAHECYHRAFIAYLCSLRDGMIFRLVVQFSNSLL